MLIDAPGIRSRLRGIVTSLVPPPLREDLMQEAMVHLWRSEQQHPGNSEAWYLQGCRFHLQNVLRHGRSLERVCQEGPHGSRPAPLFPSEIMAGAAGLEPEAIFGLVRICLSLLRLVRV